MAGEGIDGLQRRVDAWKSTYNIRGEIKNLVFEDHAVALLKARELKGFCKKLRTLPTAPLLVILETLALCMGEGDENSARDMGRLIAAAKCIRDEIGATVMLVHHTNKLGILRGSSALAAASDTVIKVARVDNAITIHCEKQKDSAAFEPIAVLLHPVTLDGGATSRAIVPALSSSDRSRPTPNAAVNRSVLRGAVARSVGNGLDRVGG